MDDFVRKVIAKDCEREYVNSSLEEMEEFIVRRMRNDFADKDIICIKFEQASLEDFSDAQSTSWFINPYYVKNISSLIEDENGKLIAFFDDDSDELDESIHEAFLYPDAYGPKMSSEFIPEILLIDAFNKNSRFLAKYYEFYDKNIDKNLSEKEFVDKFFRFLEEC